MRAVGIRDAMASVMLGVSACWAASSAAAEAAKGSGPETVLIEANGLKFPVLTWGPTRGRAVMLLHGFPQEARTWDSIASELAAAGFRVMAFDQRGYAPTNRPADLHSYNFPQFVADAVAVADACGLERFDVAGFGMGAAEAWMLGARYPGRVRSIIALRFPHPAAFAGGIRTDPAQAASWSKLNQAFGTGTVEERARRMLADNGAVLRAFLAKSGLPQPWLDRYVERLQGPGVLAATLQWEHAVVLDEFAAVPAVSVPADYLWSAGPALTASTAQATSLYAKGLFHVEELDGVGHFMIETASARVAAAMLKFYRDTP